MPMQRRRVIGKLLPSLEAADARRIAPKHHIYLHHALWGCNSFLILAVLQALEKIGDHSDILPVHRLTTCSAWIARSSHIRKEARKCLPLVRITAAKQKIARSLLRSSMAGTASAAVLLRSAHHASNVKPPYLLRAASCEPHAFQETGIATIVKLAAKTD